MQIVQKSHHVTVEQYSLSFEWKDQPGAGFGFPCTKEGVVLTEEMKPEGLANLKECQDGTLDVIAKGVRDCTYTYFAPAVGKCECGREITLHDPMTNTCECKREYNGCGQPLAPRSQWEEPYDDDAPFNAWDYGDNEILLY